MCPRSNWLCSIPISSTFASHVPFFRLFLVSTYYCSIHLQFRYLYPRRMKLKLDPPFLHLLQHFVQLRPIVASFASSRSPIRRQLLLMLQPFLLMGCLQLHGLSFFSIFCSCFCNFSVRQRGALFVHQMTQTLFAKPGYVPPSALSYVPVRFA